MKTKLWEFMFINFKRSNTQLIKCINKYGFDNKSEQLRNKIRM